MNKYEKLDKMVLKTIRNLKLCMFGEILRETEIYRECERLAYTYGITRDPFRVLDGRLQALRKEDKIYYEHFGKKQGWRIVK